MVGISKESSYGGTSVRTRESSSDDGRLTFAFSCSIGRRPFMEDSHDIISEKKGSRQVYFFGPFDGYGGRFADQCLKIYLSRNLTRHPQFLRNNRLALRNTFEETDEIVAETTYRNINDGSTASTAVLVGNTLYVANVGDSRTIMSRAGQGTGRVENVLAFSRAFGNRNLKPHVRADPDIRENVVEHIDSAIQRYSSL